MSILEETLAAAAKDGATVSLEGNSLQRLTDGVTVRRLPTHADARGSVMELYDLRWGFHPDPLVFAYTFTIRPGVVKGWGLHKRHQDRYAIIQGEMLLVLYDPRPESPTCGEVCSIVLSDRDRCLVNIPENVWHADYNMGTLDVLVVNFPTIPYDHADPDKWRLPIGSPLIPYKFPAGAQGW